MIFNLFSKRKKQAQSSEGDVLVYEIPSGLRNQIVLLIQDTIGTSLNDGHGHNNAERFYKEIHDILCREHQFLILGDIGHPFELRVLQYFRDDATGERVVDIIELVFNFINGGISQLYDTYQQHGQCKVSRAQAINELNERFKENGIGFRYTDGQLVKIDSTFIHQEVTKPALSLLLNKKFTGANEEYLKAHEHFRNGRNKECLVECLKAFESTLKTICKNKGWKYADTDTAKKLVQICFQNNLVPAYSQNQFTSLQNLLESGIPTIRNKAGGHGQGPVPQKVDDTLTRYGMNLTATNIIFLIEQSGL